MRRLTICVLLAVCVASKSTLAASYTDRFVWIFGWSLAKDSDVAEISEVLDTAARHGIIGAVVSFGLDTLCKKSPDYFRRLEEVRLACERNHIELIPAVFSVGYGGSVLAHNQNLAEGVPVEDAVFVAGKGEARFLPDASVRLVNGGFEKFTRQRLDGLNLQDQPDEVSFVDTQVVHSGKASLRLENFTSNPHGHGRMMQEVRVVPHRSYRVSVWVKTDGLVPPDAFRVQALAGSRALAPRTFDLPPTGDWRKLTLLFNSRNFSSVRLYAGLWGGKKGRVWLDDWTIEEAGPLNVLRRPGTPVTVRNESGSITYAEGKDYAFLQDPNFRFSMVDREAPSLKLLTGSRIQEGQRLRVSWFHPMVVHDSQVTVCMAEPALYEIFEHEAKLLAERLHPRRVMLNMDEVRMGGTCRACQGRNMAALLGECIAKQTQILHRCNPGVEIYVWSDMLDPNHNARSEYYLVEGDFTGSWRHVPKDLIVAVWGGPPREKSLRFFSEQHFRTLVACYYDANNLDSVKGWLQIAERTPNVRGFMYTPWQKKYALLPAFGDLLESRTGR